MAKEERWTGHGRLNNGPRGDKSGTSDSPARPARVGAASSDRSQAWKLPLSYPQHVTRPVTLSPSHLEAPQSTTRRASLLFIASSNIPSPNSPPLLGLTWHRKQLGFTPTLVWFGLEICAEGESLIGGSKLQTYLNVPAPFWYDG